MLGRFVAIEVSAASRHRGVKSPKAIGSSSRLQRRPTSKTSPRNAVGRQASVRLRTSNHRTAMWGSGSVGLHESRPVRISGGAGNPAPSELRPHACNNEPFRLIRRRGSAGCNPVAGNEICEMSRYGSVGITVRRGRLFSQCCQSLSQCRAYGQHFKPTKLGTSMRCRGPLGKQRKPPVCPCSFSAAGLASAATAACVALPDADMWRPTAAFSVANNTRSESQGVLSLAA